VPLLWQLPAEIPCGSRRRERADTFLRTSAVIYDAFQWVPTVLTLGMAYIAFWVRSASVTYEVTTQRIRVERGLLSKVKDNLELFRIDHFDLFKPLGMRLLGRCTLHVNSSDRSFPEVVLIGIPGLEAMADTLRECSLRERTRRKITALVQA
jgi:uncharacterized membrane protein YdbT with pleckstrin-like domain